MAVTAPAFSGFRPEAIQFLADLAENNDRAWFQPRKAEYERLLKRPLEALVGALAERFAERRIPLHADPARSPFRIYRDVRFSKDKSPYKTNVGASFPWVDQSPKSGAAGEGQPRHAVGGYFHLSPGDVYVGGGMWHPEKPRLDAFRRRVVDDPTGVRAIVAAPEFAAWFGSIGGDRLQRTPAGYPADHPEADLLRLKDVTFGRRLSDNEATSPRLPDLIVEGYAVALPVFRFLAGLPG